MIVPGKFWWERGEKERTPCADVDVRSGGVVSAEELIPHLSNLILELGRVLTWLNLQKIFSITRHQVNIVVLNTSLLGGEEGKTSLHYLENLNVLFLTVDFVDIPSLKSLLIKSDVKIN